MIRVSSRSLFHYFEHISYHINDQTMDKFQIFLLAKKNHFNDNAIRTRHRWSKLIASLIDLSTDIAIGTSMQRLVQCVLTIGGNILVTATELG